MRQSLVQQQCHLVGVVGVAEERPREIDEGLTARCPTAPPRKASPPARGGVLVVEGASAGKPARRRAAWAMVACVLLDVPRSAKIVIHANHDFRSDTIPRDRRPELEAAVVAAGRHLQKRFEGWIVAGPDRQEFAVRITSCPGVDISVPFDWRATAAEVTARVRAAMED